MKLPRSCPRPSKDRPWGYDDYLVLSWLQDDGYILEDMCAELFRTPEMIRQRLQELPQVRPEIESRRREHRSYHRERNAPLPRLVEGVWA